MDRTEYQLFCDRVDVPVFLQPWWLDSAAGPDHWRALTGRLPGSQDIAGIMPVCLRRKLGITYIGMPPATPFLGPWLDYPEGLKPQRRYHFERSVLDELIRQMPPVPYLRYKCHYALQDGLPFHWAGYRNTLRYTYLLDIRDLAEVQAQMSPNIRRDIRQAERALVLADDQPAERFYETMILSFTRQQLPAPFSLAWFLEMDHALSRHGAGKKLFALDQQGRIHSVAYLIWDQHSAYFWLAGDDPQLRQSGSGIWLCWQTIVYARQRGLATFDFAGSMAKNIAIVRQRFGARQQGYYQFERFGGGPLGRAARWLL